ncbi:MAG: class I SAM-dependent methyltransferase [Acidobacteriia bacterium]|nr:class I SAM-dependent methyltransferase [Terriglobia bacterium]
MVYTFKESRYSSHSAVLAQLPQPGNGRRVLDVGCAGGYLAGILASRGYQVTGIERNGGTGPDFPKEVRLIEADLEQGLPTLDGPFDVIICADILEHLRRPDLLLRQLRALLARNGVLVASLPNSGNLYFRLTVLSGRFPQEDKGLFDRTHLRFYTWEGWQALFSGAGFGLQQVLATGIPVGLAYPGHESSLAVRVAERLCYDMARVWRTLFAYQFVVTVMPRNEP